MLRSSMEWTTLFNFSAIVLSALLLRTLWKKSINGHVRLPPGPPADPIIGHARFIPHEHPWRIFGKWGQKWGGLIYIHIIGKPMIIINDLKIAQELFNKRGVIYSDRPRSVMHGELMGWEDVLGFLPYGDKFRKQRKMMQQYFNTQAVSEFHPIQHMELNTLLDNLLDTPDKFPWHIFRATASTVTMATYGRQIISDDDVYLKLIEKVNIATMEPGTPGSTMVDLIPALRYLPVWFPGAKFQRFAIDAKVVIQNAITMPYNFTRDARASGTAVSSFVGSLLDEYEQSGCLDEEDEQNIKGVAGNIFSAGVETTHSALLTFILAMVCHPEVAKRAQIEIDSGIGHDRLPTLKDRALLPFVDCILKETLRWNPPIPLGVPHRAMESDSYAGMHIPKGATVLPNIWQFMQDERYYPEPSRFDPDRFLHGTYGGLDMEDYNPLNVIFGFGRRICPGRFFAESEMWLTMANLLAAFDFKLPVDENGQEIMPEVVFTSGFASQPKDFRCRIVPRSEKHIQIIRQAATN